MVTLKVLRARPALFFHLSGIRHPYQLFFNICVL